VIGKNLLDYSRCLSGLWEIDAFMGIIPEFGHKIGIELASRISVTSMGMHMNHPQLFSLPPQTDLMDMKRKIFERPWLALRIELVTFGPAAMVRKGRCDVLPWIALLGIVGAIIGAGLGLYNNLAPMSKYALSPMWGGGSTAMMLVGVIGAASASLIAGAVTYIAFRFRSASASGFEGKGNSELLETVLAVHADAKEMMEIRAFFSQWQAVEIGRSDDVSAITGRKISHRLAVFNHDGGATLTA
jgi:hypothetical protein